MAAYLMDRPPGWWESLTTKEEFEAFERRVDLRFKALEQRLRAEVHDQITRLVRWIVPTIFAGIAALGAIVGVGN